MHNGAQASAHVHEEQLHLPRRTVGNSPFIPRKPLTLQKPPKNSHHLRPLTRRATALLREAQDFAEKRLGIQELLALRKKNLGVV